MPQPLTSSDAIHTISHLIIIKLKHQTMTKKLSASFFGDKLLTQKVYDLYLQNDSHFQDEDITNIFASYLHLLQSVSSPNQVTLPHIFIEFMHSVADQFSTWTFHSFSSVMEIAAHVFDHSFRKWLSKDQSFRYFSEVLVRHSLFRPPHSVCVFNYEQLNQITQFWIDNFVRFYEEYRQCMQSHLEEVLACEALPGVLKMEGALKEGKLVQSSEVKKFLQ